MGFFLNTLDSCRGQSPVVEHNENKDINDWMESIRTRNESVRAFVHIAEPSASGDTVQASSSALLAGVPVAVKDLIDVAGMPTRLGSQAVSRVATEHADVISSVIQEGAIIVGKSHTTEFAMSGWGISPLGRPLNPIDACDSYFPGGSSNGSASAIAAGLVPAALGTDTGGSVRIPASWCGITGLKGSPGWVSSKGVAALSQSFDVVGPMARTAADVTQLYLAMLPVARRYAFEKQLDSQDQLPTVIFLDDASLGELDAEVLAAYRAAQDHCERLGFPTRVEPIPCSFADMAATWASISSIEGYLNNKVWVENPDAPIDDKVRDNFLQGAKFNLSEYFSLLNYARHCRAQMEQLLAPGNLMVVPTTSTTATKLTEFDSQRTLGIYTRFVNLIQGCSIAVPNGSSSDGRPTSMQFIGSYGQDALILYAATHWQANTDWHLKAQQQHIEQMHILLG